MPLFEVNSNHRLQLIKERSFSLEKDIQRLAENNLERIFDLRFVRSEFPLQTFRIDTLAIDEKTNSFVILEYKRDKNFSVIDQGYAYLSLMLNNKADFILEHNEKCQTTLKRNDIDWSQSRVIFVSPSFTNYQREAINFKDLPIELWEVKNYSNSTVAFNQIKTAGSRESIKAISRNDENIERVNEEIKVYTEEEHLQKANENIIELYETIKNAILNLDSLDIKPTKHWIAFQADKNVVDINIQKAAIKLWINLRSGELDDPKNIARDVSEIGHWGNGDYEIKLSSDEQIEYIMSLVKQSLRKNKS